MAKATSRFDRRVRAALFAVGATAAGSFVAAPPAQSQQADVEEVRTLHVQDNVHLVWGAGANITVHTGEDGMLVVDTGTAEMAEAALAAIRTLSEGPIRYIVNTHAHADHVGGNAVITEAGRNIHNREELNRARILAHESVLFDMSAPTGEQADYPQIAWPTDTYFTERLDIFFNGEPVRILHMPAAHTSGDSVVHFVSSNVISAGDLFQTTQYPYIDVERGGTMNGIIEALNRIIGMMVPAPNIEEGGTLVIAGHGRVSDRYSVVVYRDMLTIIRDRVQDMIDRGMSLRQVKAARPSRDYDGRYGADSGSWTTEMFIEAVYRTLGGA